MMRRRTVVSLALRCAVVGLALGACSRDDGAHRGGEPGVSRQAIQGGATDTVDTYVVAVCVNRRIAGGKTTCEGTCTGTLIAPNLVITARHCVQQSDETVDCTTGSKFGALRTNISVTTETTIATATSWRGVRSGGVKVPDSPLVCGNDIALLTLASNVPASEATPVTPAVRFPMTDHDRYSYFEHAIGYGITAVGANDAGVRRIRKDLGILCIPGDERRDCGSLEGTQLTEREFVTSDGTCAGDSGSSAIESDSYTTAPVTLGVLSRGSEDGTTCKNGVYTRIDAWRDLVVGAAREAAEVGGYQLPAWTEPPPPGVFDAGVKETGAAEKRALASPCERDDQCGSKNCRTGTAVDAGSVCTASCTEGLGSTACPEGFNCVTLDEGGYCFEQQQPKPVNAASDDDDGCSLAPATGSRGRAGGLASVLGGLGALLLRRRRRSCASPR